jgi:hypothetical protein
VFLCFRVNCLYAHALTIFIKDARYSTYSTRHGAIGVQMAVKLETNFPISLNQQLKINLSNNWKFVVNNIQVHLCYIYINFLRWFNCIRAKRKTTKGRERNRSKKTITRNCRTKTKKITKYEGKNDLIFYITFIKNGGMFCEKSTWIELCVYIFQLLLFVKISYFQCRDSVMLCWVQSLNLLKFNGLLL